MVCSGKTLLAHHFNPSVPLKGPIALQTTEQGECVSGNPVVSGGSPAGRGWGVSEPRTETVWQ